MTMPTIQCTACGAAYPPGTPQCTNCGAPLQQGVPFGAPPPMAAPMAAPVAKKSGCGVAAIVGIAIFIVVFGGLAAAGAMIYVRTAETVGEVNDAFQQAASIPATPGMPGVPGIPGVPGVTPPNNLQGAVDPDQALSKKMNEYVNKCLNRFSDRVLRSKQRYLSWCDATKGPTGSERHIYGLYDVGSDASQCTQAVAKAAAMPPSLPALDAAAQSYSTSLAAIVPLLKAANLYYDRENYRDDGFTQGKALHGQLMPAWAAFETAHDSFSSQVDAIQDDLSTRELARLEKQGKNLRYHVQKVMVLSKRVVKGASVGNGWEDIDAAGFGAQVIGLEQAVDAMSGYATTNPAETGAERHYSSFSRDAQDFLVASKELMRRTRDRTPLTRSEKRRVGQSSEWMTNGSPGKVVHEFNSLVRQFNWFQR